jgi:hypothetical protein
VFQKTVNKPAKYSGRVRVSDRHHGDPLAARHRHTLWQRRHKGGVCESAAGIDLKDGWSSHFRFGQRMAIDLATAQVGAICWQIGQAYISNALGLGFCNGLGDYCTLLSAPAA